MRASCAHRFKKADDIGSFSFSCLRPRQCLDVAAYADGMRPRPKFRAAASANGQIPPIVLDYVQPTNLPPTRAPTDPSQSEQKLISLLRIHVGPARFWDRPQQSVVLWQQTGESWTPLESFDYGNPVDTLRYHDATYVWVYFLDRHSFMGDVSIYRLDRTGKLTEIWTTGDPDRDNQKLLGRLLKPGDKTSYWEPTFADDNLQFE